VSCAIASVLTTAVDDAQRAQRAVALQNRLRCPNPWHLKLLERRTDDDDLAYDPLTAHVVPKNCLPWQAYLSEEELKAATISVKSTSPGTDGVSVRLLKACWPGIKEHIRQLFQACMEVGHHPRPFRTAAIVKPVSKS
jgi:hypothetical protein